jgi:hypothetical protein
MWLRAADDEARTAALRVLLEMPQRALPKPTRGGGGGRVRERAMRGRIMRWEEEVRAGCLQPVLHPPEMRPNRMREETDESRRKKAEWVAVRKGIAKGAQVLERLPPITIDTEGVIGQLARQLPSRDERGSLPLRPPRAGHANVWLDWELRPQEHRGTLDRLLATHASAGPSGLELNHLRAVTRGKGEPRALAALMSLLKWIASGQPGSEAAALLLPLKLHVIRKEEESDRVRAVFVGETLVRVAAAMLRVAIAGKAAQALGGTQWSVERPGGAQIVAFLVQTLVHTPAEAAPGGEGIVAIPLDLQSARVSHGQPESSLRKAVWA